MITRKEAFSVDLQRADCLEAHCAKAVFHVDGEPWKAKEVTAQLREHAALITQAAAARAQWLKAVADERALAAKLKPVVAVAAHYVTNVFGTGSDAFIAFGLADRTAAAATVQEKALAVQKRAATRKARRTMGKKAKLEIRGDVVEDRISAA